MLQQFRFILRPRRMVDGEEYARVLFLKTRVVYVTTLCRRREPLEREARFSCT